ncbi:DUF402 domain-containing protein [Pseudalkalibacillus hwajinpoensis]|uniref:DUF402 domain-containing protein n=1 Tax=Guptibacillus hwajinpoensis TaxID=208199 RepID=UPI001F15EC1B|nr:DUF402 domain-containing protein [Pseudalkalibacillus hwajinpoensis]
MLKRKNGDRADWKRVEKRKYAQKYLNTREFNGFINLLNTIKVTQLLITHYADKEMPIVDNGGMWLQQFPLEKKYSVTTMFNAEGKIVQWHIDICLQNGFGNGVPWMDDFYLDVVVLPSGEVIQLDEDELEDALSRGLFQKTYMI